MNINLVEKAESIINEAFKENEERTKIVSQGLEPRHAQETKKWVLRLNPQASESLQIAALGHDIERVFRSTYVGYKGKLDIDEYNKYKKQHAKRSADIISEKLELAGFPKTIVNRVKYLIENHDNFSSFFILFKCFIYN
jgi:HD-GYP domain-containing protein (c-di-GMP phosphodiesterase class II)